MTAVNYDPDTERDGNALVGIVVGLLTGAAYWYPVVGTITGRHQITGRSTVDIALATGIIGPIMCVAALTILSGLGEIAATFKPDTTPGR